MKGIDAIEFDRDEVEGKCFAIVVTRWNKHIVDPLLAGATAYLTDKGVRSNDITVVTCPGAFEVPLTCQKLADTGHYDGIVALGAVIRGDTPHFEFVAGECARGLSQVSLDYGLPVAFGVLTVDNEAQALIRSGHGEGAENKGEEAASAALEMALLCKRI